MRQVDEFHGVFLILHLDVRVKCGILKFWTFVEFTASVFQDDRENPDVSIQANGDPLALLNRHKEFFTGSIDLHVAIAAIEQEAVGAVLANGVEGGDASVDADLQV